MKVIAFNRTESLTLPSIARRLYLQDGSPESYTPFTVSPDHGLIPMALTAYASLLKNTTAVPLTRSYDYEPGNVLLCVPAAYCDESWSTEHFQWVAEANLFVRYLSPDKVSRSLQHWVMCLLLMSTYAAIKEDWEHVERYSERTTDVTKLFNKLHGRVQ